MDNKETSNKERADTREVLEEVRQELKNMNACRRRNKKEVSAVLEEQEYREEMENLVGFILVCLILLGFMVWALTNEVIRLKQIVLGQRQRPASKMIGCDRPMNSEESKEQPQPECKPRHKCWLLVTDLE